MAFVKAVALAVFAMVVVTLSTTAYAESTGRSLKDASAELSLSSTCPRSLVIASEKGKRVIDMTFTSGKALSGSKQECYATGMRGGYWFANECKLKKKDCCGFYLYKEKKQAMAKVCYVMGKCTIANAPANADSSYKCFGAYVNAK